MSFSLNEVEAMGKKAARGAGHPWGLAEEAGRAARWLCAQGLDGCAELAAVLAATPPLDGPAGLASPWHARRGTLCPLQAGAALSDCGWMLEAGDIDLQGLAHPLVILPFAAAAAGRLGIAVTVTWEGVRAVVDARGLALEGAPGPGPVDVTVRAGGTPARRLPRTSRAAPDPATWQALEALAARTYAPATAESRLKGAGAGLSDND